MARGQATGRAQAIGRIQRVNAGSGSTPPPPDPAPTLVSGPSLYSRTVSTITVTFTSDQFVSAYMQYGTTAGYGYESAHENSFNYQTHIQQITGLAANTTYHFRVHIANSAGQTFVSDDVTFSTLDNPPPPVPDFDVGYTYTDVVWPTGTGWTAGALSTIRTNINNLIASSGNGADFTHHVRHLLAPGAVYPIDTYINLLGRAHITFEGGGTEASTSPFGHSGGATISTINVSGTSSRQQIFTGGTSTTVTYNDIRWHGLTLRGNGVNLASSTAGQQTSESQHGIGSFGGTNCLVSHCIFTDFQGDNIYLSESRGTDGIQSGPWSENWELRYNQFLKAGRQGIAPGQGARNVNIHHNYFADPAYNYIDFEGNRAYQSWENVNIDDNVFGGHWCWAQTGGPDGQGYAASAIYFTNIQDGATYGGYLNIRRNLVTGIHASPFYNSSVRQFIMSAPWGDLTCTGSVLIEDNVKTSTKQNGPIVTMNRVTGGPLIVRNNTDWKTATGNWLLANNGVTPTQSGNT